MIFIYNYFKLFIWSTIYYNKKEKSELIENIIIKNIKNKGCITIKFIQWFLPKINSMNNIPIKYNRFLNKLDDLYENCNFHDDNYTFKVYQGDFGVDFHDKYEIIETIASGSIGQVYKIKDKNDKIYAMKCLHPEVDSQINTCEKLLKIISSIPLIRNNLQYYLPININNFINDFKSQVNLSNEANNLLSFGNIYKEIPYIVIPELINFSKHIMIMSYEEGMYLNDSTISDYLKQKIMILFRVFTKNNELITNFMHGDLHNGNWRVRVNKTDVYLVLYDFGFCWNIPSSIKDSLKLIDDAFFDISINQFNVDKFTSAGWHFMDKCVEYQEVYDVVKKYEKKDVRDSRFLLNMILDLSRTYNVLINSYIIQSLILYTQIIGNFENHGMASKINDTGIKRTKNGYLSSVYDMVNYCETYHVFNDFKEYISEDLKIYEDKSKESTSILCVIDDAFNDCDLEMIKKLAIK